MNTGTGLRCLEGKNPGEIFHLTLFKKWQLRGEAVPLCNQEPIFICWEWALRENKFSPKRRKEDPSVVSFSEDCPGRPGKGVHCSPSRFLPHAYHTESCSEDSVSHQGIPSGRSRNQNGPRTTEVDRRQTASGTAKGRDYGPRSLQTGTSKSICGWTIIILGLTMALFTHLTMIYRVAIIC